MTEVDKADITYVEDIEDGRVSATDGSGKKKVMGTVKLTEGKVVYIPTPTADPQGITLLSHVLRPGVLTKHIVDPLNMAIWQKWIVLVVISICQSLQRLLRVSVLTMNSLDTRPRPRQRLRRPSGLLHSRI